MNIKASTKNVKPRSSVLLPFIVAITGSIVGIAANFIKYVPTTKNSYSWETSFFTIIAEANNNPETHIPDDAYKLLFGIIVVGICLSVLSVLFVLLRKMKVAIVFSILTFLLFLLEKAWIHYIGFALVIIGIIWYMIVDKKNSFYAI